MNKPEDIISTWATVRLSQSVPEQEKAYTWSRVCEFAKQTVFLSKRDLIARPANAWEYYNAHIDETTDDYGDGKIRAEYADLFNAKGGLI